MNCLGFDLALVFFDSESDSELDATNFFLDLLFFLFFSLG